MRILNKKGLIGAVKITFFLVFLIILGFFIYNILPAFASPDAIWTTRDDCGDIKQDVNHFAIGEHVYVNGEGFSAGDYNWKIRGKPGGGSCDPNAIVASGTYNVDSSGNFCFDAYTVQPDDCGEYQVKFGVKGDNYRVKDCAAYTDSSSCELDSECDWCTQCSDSKYSGGIDRCVAAGTCNYWCEYSPTTYCGAQCESDNDCVDYCSGDIRYYSGTCNFGCVCSYSSEDCDNNDGCYIYESGCEDREYFCSSGGCDYTYSNRSTDYHDDFVFYCSDDTIRKHRQFHDFYCNEFCSDHTSWQDDQLVEDCDSKDGWYNTTNTRWVNSTQCTEKEEKEQEYRNYYCSENQNIECLYTVTNTQWIDTGETRNKPLSTPCDNGLYCDGPDHCDDYGSCVPLGNPVDCSSLTDQCNLGFCNENTDRCEYNPFPTSTFCDNELYCDGPDHCDATNAGGLTPAVCVNLGPSIDCSYLDNECQEGICDEDADECVPDYTNYSWSTPCELDDNLCTIDHCDGSGSCVNYDNVTVPQPQECKSFYCDPSDGLTKENYTNYPLSTTCEADEDLCTFDHCSGSGACVTYDYVSPPSIPNKTVGEPKVVCEEGDWCDYKITILTPITLSCENNTVWWRYALDGEWGEWQTNTSPVTIFFPEESNHTLEAYCVDVCGESPVDSENFKVEGTAFELNLYKKWNLISVPFVLLNNTPEEVFKNIKDNISSVWAYDNYTWYFWSTDGAPKNLDTIRPGWGYWVLANNNTKLIIGGSLFSPITVPPSRNLVEGWNLIGYYGTDWQEYLDGYDNCGDYYEYGNYAYCALNSLIDTQQGFPRWSSLLTHVNCGDHNAYWIGLNICNKTYAGKGYWILMDVEDLYAPATTCIWNDNFICPQI